MCKICFTLTCKTKFLFKEEDMERISRFSLSSF